jgi:hypothetical protein
MWSRLVLGGRGFFRLGCRCAGRRHQQAHQEQQNAAGKEEKARSRLSFHHEDITLLFALSLRSRKANRVICKSIGETTVVQEGMDSMPAKTAQPDRRAHWVNTSGRNRKSRAASKANGADQETGAVCSAYFS